MRFFLLFFFFIFLSSCQCSGGKNRTDAQWTRDMSKQHNVKAQEGTDEGGILMRVPPEGTVARNRVYYPYKKNIKKAEERLKNPYELTPDFLKLGETNYKRYCIYCHGETGDSGFGANVGLKMNTRPLSLVSNKAKAYKDGRIYHIISEGQGTMGSYRIPLQTSEQALMENYIKDDEYKGSKNIWSVVYYVRFLQKKYRSGDDGKN